MENIIIIKELVGLQTNSAMSLRVYFRNLLNAINIYLKKNQILLNGID